MVKIAEFCINNTTQPKRIVYIWSSFKIESIASSHLPLPNVLKSPSNLKHVYIYIFIPYS